MRWPWTKKDTPEPADTAVGADAPRREIVEAPVRLISEEYDLEGDDDDDETELDESALDDEAVTHAGHTHAAHAHAAHAVHPHEHTYGEPDENGLVRVARLEMIPNELAINVFLTEFESADGPLPAWLMSSEGLLGAGQKEVILGVRRREGETPEQFPQDPAALVFSMYQRARTGDRADVGATAALGGDQGLLGRPDFRGVIFTHPAGHGGDPGFLAEWLSLVIVTEEELKIAERFGHTRLLAKLGQRYTFFPTPPWTDRDRAPVFTAADLESSILAQPAPTISAYEGSVWMAGGTTGGASAQRSWTENTVHAQLPQRLAAMLQGAIPTLPPEAPLIFYTGIAPDVTRCLVYPPDGGSALTIGDARSDDPRVAGNFLALVRGQPETSVRTVEDGFAVFLDADDTATVFAALADGQPVHLDRGAADGLSISWIPAPGA